MYRHRICLNRLLRILSNSRLVFELFLLWKPTSDNYFVRNPIKLIISLILSFILDLCNVFFIPKQTELKLHFLSTYPNYFMKTPTLFLPSRPFALDYISEIRRGLVRRKCRDVFLEKISN